LKFWDSSALVPLLVTEPATRHLQSLAEREAKKLVWWATEAECASAITRRLREQTLDSAGASLALDRLRQLVTVWDEIEPSAVVRDTAIRFLRVHPLRAADALQLAAAFIASDGRPTSLGLVTLDDRLAEAARKEGFAVIDAQAS
jgi:predicted nucleic acid-binding protein